MSGVSTSTQRTAPGRTAAPVVRLLPVIPNVMLQTACANPWDRELTGFTAKSTFRHLGSSPT